MLPILMEVTIVVEWNREGWFMFTTLEINTVLSLVVTLKTEVCINEGVTHFSVIT